MDSNPSTGCVQFEGEPTQDAPSQAFGASGERRIQVRFDTPKEDVFAELLRFGLEQIRSGEREVLEAGDGEGLHRMRVALRRWRALTSMFRGELPDGTLEAERDSIRHLRDVLGGARDWDVLLTGRLHPAAGSGAVGRRWLDEVRILAEQERSGAWDRVRKFLRSSEYTRTMEAITAWSVGLRWREEMSSKALRRFRGPVGELGLAALSRGHKRLKRAGAKAVVAGDADWHRLRIAIKKQRYRLDAFRECLSTKETGRYSEALKRIQEELGALQDLATARTLFAEMALRGSEGVAAFLEGGVISLEQERACLRRSARRLWDEFAERKCPWHD